MKDIKNYRYHKDSRYPEAKKYRDEAEGNMKRDIDALLKSGNKAQREKLEENGHKDDFNNTDIFHEFKRLEDEAEELYVEMFNIDTGEALPVVDYKKVRREFADVANRAHLGILACDKEIKK